MMIMRGSIMNVEKGHKPTTRVGVNPGAIQEVILEAIQETIPGTKPEPTAKALPMPIPEVCIPHL